MFFTFRCSKPTCTGGHHRHSQPNQCHHIMGVHFQHAPLRFHGCRPICCPVEDIQTDRLSSSSQSFKWYLLSHCHRPDTLFHQLYPSAGRECCRLDSICVTHYCHPHVRLIPQCLINTRVLPIYLCMTNDGRIKGRERKA